MVPSSSGEFALIQRYFRWPLTRTRIGPGDDAALLDLRPDEQLVVSSDMLVEGHHFFADVDPVALGHKALAVNLSDLAACAAQPLAFTLALALPRVDDAWLSGFAAGLRKLADAHAIDLAGGDLTAGPLTLCLTVMGTVPRGAMLTRAGARPGDELWVSGILGDARLALDLRRGRLASDEAAWDVTRAALERPEPRVALGLALRGLASAALDLSDGLSGDLVHLIEASGVGAEVAVDALPCSSTLAARPVAERRHCQIAGGDDYELLFSAPAQRHAAVRAAAAAVGVAVSPIGRILAGGGVRWLDATGHALPVGQTAAWASYDHFHAPNRC